MQYFNSMVRSLGFGVSKSATLAAILWAVPATAGSIQVTIVIPGANANADAAATLPVQVLVSSAFELASVTARVVGGASTNLVYSPSTGRWTNVVSLAGLESGSYALAVSARDLLGGTAEASQSLQIDAPPTLTVEEPITGTVVQGKVYISVAATDHEGNTFIQVSIPGRPAVFGTNHIRGFFPINAISGNTRVAFTAADGAGHTRIVIRPIIVEASSNLTERASAPGTILDYDDTRFLFSVQEEFILSANPTFSPWPFGRPEPRLQDRQTGAIRTGRTAFSSWVDGVLDTSHPGYIASGRLGTTGALLWTGNLLPNVPLSLLGWDGGNTANLGLLQYSPLPSGYPGGDPSLAGRSALVVRRGFGVKDDALVLQDIIDPELRYELAFPALTVSVGGLGPNLDVVYVTTNSVVRNRPANVTEPYAGRSSTVLSTNVAGGVLGLGTDGSNVVYVATVNGNAETKIQLIAEAGEETLATWPGISRPAFQLNQGWAAYTRPGSAGQTQIWTRAPSGDRVQRTLFAESSQLESLGPQGEVTFLNGSGRYVSFPGSRQPFWVNSGQGRVHWDGGRLCVILGRSILEFGLGRLVCTALAEGMTRLEFSGPDGLTYAILRSNDLQHWTAIETFTVSGNVKSLTIQAPDSPAFYRAVVVPPQ